MTSSAPTVVRTITADEIRDVTHYCHMLVMQPLKRESHFSSFTPRADPSNVNFLSDGTMVVISN